MDIFMQHDIQELSRVVSHARAALMMSASVSLLSTSVRVPFCVLSLQLLDNIESKMKGTSVEVSSWVAVYLYIGIVKGVSAWSTVRPVQLVCESWLFDEV